MSLLPLFQWCERSTIGAGIRDSMWLFPVLEAVHLLGLCVLGGAVLIVDFRLIGLGLLHRPVSEVAADVHVWLLTALGVSGLTGVLLFLSEATKCYYNPAFWGKMVSLGMAILFTFTVRQYAVRACVERQRWNRVVGILSLAFWSGVGVGGRAIGFY